MTAEENSQLQIEVYAWALQCSTEIAPRLNGPPPCVSATIELLERMDELVRPRLAIAGRFNAGKTALVNAMLGSNVLMEGMTEVTAIPREQVEEGTVGQTRRLVDSLGLSEKEYQRYVHNLFREYRASLEQLNALVNASEHLVGYHLDFDAVCEFLKERSVRLDEIHLTALRSILANSEKHKGDPGSGQIVVALAHYWGSTKDVFCGHLIAAFQTAATLGWRFETPPAGGGDIAAAFGALWDWDAVRDTLCAPLLDGYGSVLQNATKALKEHHKLHQLHNISSYLVGPDNLLDSLGMRQ